jgi:polar amino acid transport system substrate-binding protein
VALSDDVDLATGVIAAQANTIQSGYIAESGATLLEYATPDETVAAVRNGEADAVFADIDFLTDITDEDDELMVVGDPVPLGGGVGMGLRETDGELREMFNAAITSMKEDGTLNALLVEWFGDDVPTYE